MKRNKIEIELGLYNQIVKEIFNREEGDQLSQKSSPRKPGSNYGQTSQKSIGSINSNYTGYRSEKNFGRENWKKQENNYKNP